MYFEGDPDDEDDKGVCIYLDSLSAHLYGNPETAERDREIRNWLRRSGYNVTEITYVELDDKNVLVHHFRKLAKYLSGKELADRIKQDKEWFERK